jgi:hypothetical protein
MLEARFDQIRDNWLIEGSSIIESTVQKKEGNYQHQPGSAEAKPQYEGWLACRPKLGKSPYHDHRGFQFLLVRGAVPAFGKEPAGRQRAQW